MRGIHVAVIAAVWGIVAALRVDAAPTRQPNMADIDTIERTVQLPPHAHRLGDYARYYTVESSDGRDLIKGYFLLDGPDPAGRYLRQSPVRVFDGGCSVVTALYDVRTRHVTKLWCNGVG